LKETRTRDELPNKELVNQRDKNQKAWSVGVYMPDRPFSVLRQVEAVMRSLGRVSSTFVNVFFGTCSNSAVAL